MKGGGEEGMLGWNKRGQEFHGSREVLLGNGNEKYNFFKKVENHGTLIAQKN